MFEEFEDLETTIMRDEEVIEEVLKSKKKTKESKAPKESATKRQRKNEDLPKKKLTKKSVLRSNRRARTKAQVTISEF